MLTEAGRRALGEALDGLRAGEAGAWSALAPLSRLSSEGVEVSIDFTTEAQLGAPVIIVRPGALPVEGLTARQREVLALVGRGLSNKAIARALGISPGTVKDHVHAVLAALGMASRAEVIARLHGRQSG
jgi:DNA-binding NarL/FixJ family response regulator